MEPFWNSCPAVVRIYISRRNVSSANGSTRFCRRKSVGSVDRPFARRSKREPSSILPSICRSTTLTSTLMFGCFPWIHNRVLSIVQSDTERHQMEEALRIQKDLGTRLAEAGNMKTALAQVLKAMMQIPGMDACGIYLMDSQTGDFCLAAYQGISARMAKAMAHIESNTRMAACILDGHTMYDRFRNLDPHRIAAHQMKRWRATGVIPVLNEGRVVASLNFCSQTQDEFPPTARSLFEAIANQIGGVLTRLEAQDLLQKAHDELDRQVREANAFPAKGDGNPSGERGPDPRLTASHTRPRIEDAFGHHLYRPAYTGSIAIRSRS